MTTAALTALAAILLDWLFGEPGRHRPLVAFGKLVNWVERRFHRFSCTKASGTSALLLPLTTISRVVTAHGLQPAGGCALFQWVPTLHAEQLFDRLARNAILTRCLPQPSALRFDLPSAETEWHGLERALIEIDPIELQGDLQ